jgi:hypothetical protein
MAQGRRLSAPGIQCRVYSDAIRQLQHRGQRYILRIMLNRRDSTNISCKRTGSFFHSIPGRLCSSISIGWQRTNQLSYCSNCIPVLANMSVIPRSSCGTECHSAALDRVDEKLFLQANRLFLGPLLRHRTILHMPITRICRLTLCFFPLRVPTRPAAPTPPYRGTRTTF